MCFIKNIKKTKRTHCSQKPPTSLEPAIKKLHSALLRLRNTGNFNACDLANIDQTLSPFVLDDGKTYDKKGIKEVWVQSGQSNLDKRQATVQLIVFADAVDRVRPVARPTYFSRQRSCIKHRLGVIKRL